MGKVIALLAVICLAGCHTAGQPTTVATPHMRSFEFLGCSGDFKGKFVGPEVWRVTTDGPVTFLTHHVDNCGLSGRNPTVTARGGSLDLSYEMHGATDAIVMCDCEYWAKFTFGAEALGAQSVTVGGQPAEPRGDWPGR